MCKRLFDILDKEEIKYDKKNIMDVVKYYYPDVRSMVNKLQKHKTQLTQENLIYSLTKGVLDSLMASVKTGNFADIRNIVANEYQGMDSIYIEIYNSMREYLTPECFGKVIMLIEDSQRYHNNVMNVEIHIMDFLWKLYKTAEFK
ncbi:unnamed protein product [marine sediment metagenome]|uniref:Uncharacterized protein n=1 Tax=marine sediment metagenome TaxID=412755 RepID=X0XWS9_9ZZZZ